MPLPFLLPALLLPALLAATPPEPMLHVKVPARDGVELCVNVWLPAARGRFAAAVYRTPYRKTDRLTPGLRQFRDAGYVVVLQDVRGRGHSAGAFRQLLQEENDTFDLLQWMTRQPWFDGRAGLFGGSYPGISAWRGALSRHPAIRAIAPSFSGGDEYMDRYYSAGGAFRSGHRLWWMAENFNLEGRKRPSFADVTGHLPLRDADRFATGQTLDFFQAAMAHPSYDAYWRSLSTLQASARLRVPAHVTGGWFDPYCGTDLEMFDVLRAAGLPVRLILGPWGHNPSVPLETVNEQGAPASLRGFEIDWFNHWVRGAGRAADPVIRYFVMGANLWRETPHWPPPGTTSVPVYLAGGRANSARGSGRLQPEPPRRAQPDEFQYDPANPAPTRGGATCCNPRMIPWGPLDQREVEAREDVLVYTGEPLAQPLEISGPVRAVLWVRSSAPDTDFTAKVVDVAPDGPARLVCDGILRMRYRRGLERPVAYRPGQVERITIPLGSIAWQLAPGHRLRLEVSSSNFPKYDRNLNTGRPAARESTMRTARQSVLRDQSHPSHLLLPVRRSDAEHSGRPLASRIATPGNGSLR
jgi:putative CocE/NonD family hydrolase